MSLISFHRALIVTAIAFCLGFAGWELNVFLDGPGAPGALLMAILFAFLAAGLTFYLARLRSFLHPGE